MLKTTDVKKIIDDFASKKQLYLSEVQFQFELAWEIKSRFNGYNVHLEYPSASCRSYYDIVVEDGKEYYVIELKYKTKKQNITYKGNTFTLKDHAAQDLGRYDYLYDISKIEKWSKFNPNKKFTGGCAIMLTNDSVYWTKNGAKCIYKDFALEDKTSISAGAKHWKAGTSVTSVGKQRIGGFDLSNNYDILWEDYCDKFKYLIEEVK